jgi:hypothetical protein
MPEEVPEGTMPEQPASMESPGAPESMTPEPMDAAVAPMEAAPMMAAPAAEPEAAPAAPAAAAQESGWQTPGESSTFGVPIAPGPVAGVTYADLVPRIVAYIIDAIILGIGYAIVWSILIATLFVSGGLGGVWVGLIVGSVALLAASAVYFIWTWTHWRASPGQRILSIETVNAPNGATLSQDQAIRRWLFLYGPGAISSAVGLAPIGFLSTLISLAVLGYYIYLLYSASQDPRRQGFHDKQVDTVVVKRSAV